MKTPPQQPSHNSPPQPSRLTADNSNVFWNANSKRRPLHSSPGTPDLIAPTPRLFGRALQPVPRPLLGPHQPLLLLRMDPHRWNWTLWYTDPDHTFADPSPKPKNNAAMITNSVTTAGPSSTASQPVLWPHRPTIRRRRSRPEWPKLPATPTPRQKPWLRDNPEGPPEQQIPRSPSIPSSRHLKPPRPRLPTLLRRSERALFTPGSSTNGGGVEGHSRPGGFGSYTQFYRLRFQFNAFSTQLPHVPSNSTPDGRWQGEPRGFGLP
jgi:hypothetical protein